MAYAVGQFHGVKRVSNHWHACGKRLRDASRESLHRRRQQHEVRLCQFRPYIAHGSGQTHGAGQARTLAQELVDIYFRKPVDGELGEFMPVSRALQIIGGNITRELSDRKIGRAFMDLGFRFKRTNTSRGYVVVQRSAVEIKERLHLQASDEVTL